MTLLKIIEVPDKRLKKISSPVAKIDDEIKALMQDMLVTMREADGLGLAAPQVGVNKRVVVLDVPHRISGDDEPIFMINPEILWSSEGVNSYKEGCLSLPEQYAEVERPAEVKVKYLNENGDEKEAHADALFATVVQHELDHLDGVVFVDHLSRIKRNMLLRKLTKYQKENSGE
ncbi:MAG: peptide deformylase [Alphaproteobacteria bacterium]|nr:peptide deformylase [Alphaproteobacteria bacterium]